MRWASKPLPVDDERKIVRKFAWFPKRMADEGVTIWFRHYWLCREWTALKSTLCGYWHDRGHIEDDRIARMWRDKKMMTDPQWQTEYASEEK